MDGVRIEVERAPLSTESLRAIGELYGQQDRKYRDVDYVRLLTEANPSGHSVHAFARTKEASVGHYMMIPLALTRAGTTGMSAKGEAFWVEEAFRTSRTRDGLLIGVALLDSSFTAAEADGVDVIHAVTRPEVGMLARLNGCREVPIEFREYSLVFGPELDHIPQTKREWASAGLGLLQGAVSRGWRPLARLGGGTEQATPTWSFTEDGLGQ